MTTSHDILATIGGTPLVRLRHVAPRDGAEVWLKLEGLNPTGSYKDRLALGVVQGLLDAGAVRPGDRLVEYTGGSTGTSLAFVCAVMGLGFVAVSSNAFAESKLASMRAFGAQVLIEDSPDGTITPALIQRMKARAHALAGQPGACYADQFGSPYIRPAYAAIGREIVAALGTDIAAVCASVGTAGGLMGTLDGLRAAGCRPDAFALEPLQAPLLTTGVGGAHKVEGIAIGFVPPHLDQARMTGYRAIDQEDAFAMCRRLAREEGILAGPSTGLNVAAAIALAATYGPGKRVVTLACDSGLKYLGGSLFT